MPAKSPNEMFYIEGGQRRDAALHLPILNNPSADRLLAREAVERAITRGTSPDLAERLWGVKP